jgi:CHAT domain-containing protein
MPFPAAAILCDSPGTGQVNVEKHEGQSQRPPLLLYMQRKYFPGMGATIENLPPEILEDIFRFYCQDAMALSRGRPWEWHRLTHVCQTWRSIILNPMNRLGLQLFCTNGSPVRKILHCWPYLPIVMRYAVFPGPNPLAAGDVEEIAAALQQPGRLRIIQLTVTIPLLEKLATTKQEPKATVTQERFSELEHLELTTQDEAELVLHDQFLGGAAPRLHTLRTTRIALPALPRLLLSATNLVSLQLEAIPSTGYIPPEYLIITLAPMSRLQMLHVHFLSPTSHSDPMESTYSSPDPANLRFLKYFEFYGGSTYLEQLSDGIIAPAKYIYISYFNDLEFNIPKLVKFLGRAKTPSFRVEATVYYSATDISITFSQQETPCRLAFRIPCRRFDWQMFAITEISDQLLPSITHSVQQLDIYASPPFPDDHDDMDHTLFLDLFRIFTNVESLRVTKEVGFHVAHALTGTTDETDELPNMQEIFVEDHDDFASVQTALAPFITARRLSNRLISVHPWKPSDSSTNQLHSSMEEEQDRAIEDLKSSFKDVGLVPSSRPKGGAGTGSAHIPESIIHTNDPTSALEEDIRQTGESFSPNSFAIHSLYQRAKFLRLSFVRSHITGELENSIEIARDLLEMRPKQLRRVKLLRMLAFCHALGTHDPGHKNKSVSMFEDAFQDESATTSERLNIAWWWATFARAWGHPTATLAYQNTLSALQLAFTGLFTIKWQSSIIGRLGSKIHIPLEYASYQIEEGQLELAVETIEQGKTLIWSEIYGLRTSAGRLLSVDPYLANRLATVNQKLLIVNASILDRRAVGSGSDEEDDHEYIDTFSPTFKEQRRLLHERQEIVAGIKALPGFENFMETVRFGALQNAASRGPIIVINHCRWRCDILIILRDSPPSHIQTTKGFYERTNTLASTLLDAQRKYAVESELYQQELRSILKELFELVGRPVLNRLRELGIVEQSRIWWYPTSVFCSLPLHAMGPVPSTDGRERYFSDLYICSYTPSLGALIAARTPTAPTSNREPTLLLVDRRNESLKSTRDMKMSIGVPGTRLVFGNATKEAVINGLHSHRLAHFACRSHREEGKPFDTALELGGDDRLALLDIVHFRVPTTELAVLSCDRTAELVPVDGTDVVEGLHLTAAMQYYGFGSVIGTMWDLGDAGGEDVFQGFYKEILSGGTKDGTSPSERSARALQSMVQNLRETRGTLQQWANWVHYGV